MRRTKILVRFGCALSILLGGSRVLPQTLPATTEAALLDMASRASVIFAGTVVAVDRADASGYVDVRFRIDAAVRGASGKDFYVLREWSGLWGGGVERYKTGQRLLMLLHARSSSGFSSPVNGLDGAIPILAGGNAPLVQGAGSGPADTATAPPEPVVDLRWVSTGALRGTQVQEARSTSTAGVKAWTGPVKPLATSVQIASSPGAMTMTAVIGLLEANSGDGPAKKPIESQNGRGHEGH